MDIKEKLRQEVWKSHKYYHVAKEGSLDTGHKGMQILRRLAQQAIEVLDLGCGEGTRLNLVLAGEQRGTGIDISQTAIKLGKKSYSKLKLIEGDLENVPLESESFNLVYSAYVLEHLSKPEQVLKEAIRLTQKGGYLVLIAPNYGSPNRASPPYKGSRLKKILTGFIDDFIRLFRKQKELEWESVEPIANKTKYDIDWDTTVEPYIGSLVKFLEGKELIIEEALSCWSEELADAKLHQKIFKMLGKMGIYPFWMWGPHLIVVAKKV